MEQITHDQIFAEVGRLHMALLSLRAERDTLKQVVEALKKQNALLSTELERAKEKVE